MDRRQQKTRNAIFKAFSELLENRRYNSITVQEIIDKADIGRSTFYAHFETKDELLKSMCTNIFTHVFLEDMPIENPLDYDNDELQFLQAKISHILYHLKTSEVNIRGILSSESEEIFMRYFKDYLFELFSNHINIKTSDVPIDFLTNHLIDSFASTIKWWITKKPTYSPESIAKFYISVIKI